MMPRHGRAQMCRAFGEGPVAQAFTVPSVKPLAGLPPASSCGHASGPNAQGLGGACLAAIHSRLEPRHARGMP